MINGDLNDFIDGLYYGDERRILYKGAKYFVQGITINNENFLQIFNYSNVGDDIDWYSNPVPRGTFFPVEELLHAKIWDGKSFWEIHNEIEWIDD